jgi:dihydrolipoamide dehydrogenase
MDQPVEYGGGIIGMEMAAVYHALGSRISVVELTDQLIPGADKDLVAPLMNRVRTRYEHIMLQTAVEAVEAKDDVLLVYLNGPGSPSTLI